MTLQTLTARQRQLLGFIQAYQSDNGMAPTLEEMAEAMGVRSLATIHEHLAKMEWKGCIRRSPRESRSIVTVDDPREEVLRLRAENDRLRRRLADAGVAE